MAATRQDIRGWFNRAKEEGATHMVVVCDTFDNEDYPVSVLADQDVRDVVKEYDGKSMQRVMEVYDLSKDRDEQVNFPGRVFNL